MAKGVTDSVHYEQIANALRLRTQAQRTFAPGEMAQAVEEVYINGEERGLSVGAENGYAIGVREEAEKCAARHFAQVITGDGTDTIRFQVPFVPDAIAVSNHDPDLRMTKGILVLVQLEPSAVGQLAGLYAQTSGPVSGTTLGSYTNALASTTTLPERYSRDEEGNVILSNFGAVFGDGVDYIVTAVKCIEKSDKERIVQIVEGLPAGGTYKIHISQTKKEAAFTEEEWDSLIATKSTYTFVMC